MIQHFDMLGRSGEDLVTGFSGVVTTLSFDLYGCVQVVLTPKANADKGIREGQWLDVTRVKLHNGQPVMALPDFEKGYVATGAKGASMKTLPK